MMLQVARRSFSQDSQYDIVDRSAERRSDRAKIRERLARPCHDPFLRNRRRVPRRRHYSPRRQLGHQPRRHPQLPRALRHRRRILDCFDRRVDRRADRALNLIAHRLREPPNHARRPRRHPRLRRLRDVRRLRAKVVHHVQQLHARHPIDQAVMHLPQQRRAISFQVVERVQLPQGMLAVERFLIYAHHFGHRLRFAQCVGQLMEMHVVVERVFWVVLHHGVRQIQRNFDQPLPVARHQMHPCVEVLQQRVEIEAAFEQSDRTDMQRTALRLAVDKGRVLRRQSIAREGWKCGCFGHLNSPPSRISLGLRPRRGVPSQPRKSWK